MNPIGNLATSKRWPLVLGGLLAVAVGAALFYLLPGDKAEKSGSSKAPPLVALVRSEVADLPHIVETQGHVVPINEVEVRSQINGVVSSLNLQEGQNVTAGQLLFVLDAGDAPALVKQAQAKYAQTTAELDEARRITGDKVVRAYRLYLAGSAMAFEHGWLSLHQTLATRPSGSVEDGSLRGAQSAYPFNREYIYR